MRILVTGGAGFLGRHLVPKLRERGNEVSAPTSRECDLRLAGSLAALEGASFDRIFHLAAWTRAGRFCDLRRGEQWIVNQQINTNVVTWWHEKQPQAKLIAMGTSASYSDGLPLSEENYLAGTPSDAYVAYATSKRAMLVGMQSLARQFGHRFLCVVPSTLYGPDYPLDGRELHFIYDVIRKILDGSKSNADVVLWGDGHQRRELVFIDDFVEILLQLAERAGNEVINIGAGKSHSIRDFARSVCEIVGYPYGRIRFDEGAFVGLRSKCLDVSLLDSILPARPATPLNEGLRRTVEWMVRSVR